MSTASNLYNLGAEEEADPLDSFGALTGGTFGLGAVDFGTGTGTNGGNTQVGPTNSYGTGLLGIGSVNLGVDPTASAPQNQYIYPSNPTTTLSGGLGQNVINGGTSVGGFGGGTTSAALLGGGGTSGTNGTGGQGGESQTGGQAQANNSTYTFAPNLGSAFTPLQTAFGPAPPTSNGYQVPTTQAIPGTPNSGGGGSADALDTFVNLANGGASSGGAPFLLGGIAPPPPQSAPAQAQSPNPVSDLSGTLQQAVNTPQTTSGPGVTQQQPQPAPQPQPFIGNVPPTVAPSANPAQNYSPTQLTASADQTGTDNGLANPADFADNQAGSDNQPYGQEANILPPLADEQTTATPDDRLSDDAYLKKIIKDNEIYTEEGKAIAGRANDWYHFANQTLDLKYKPDLDRIKNQMKDLNSAINALSTPPTYDEAAKKAFEELTPTDQGAIAKYHPESVPQGAIPPAPLQGATTKTKPKWQKALEVAGKIADTIGEHAGNVSDPRVYGNPGAQRNRLNFERQKELNAIDRATEAHYRAQADGALAYMRSDIHARMSPAAQSRNIADAEHKMKMLQMEHNQLQTSRNGESRNMRDELDRVTAARLKVWQGGHQAINSEISALKTRLEKERAEQLEAYRVKQLKIAASNAASHAVAAGASANRSQTEQRKEARAQNKAVNLNSEGVPLKGKYLALEDYRQLLAHGFQTGKFSEAAAKRAYLAAKYQPEKEEQKQ